MKGRKFREDSVESRAWRRIFCEICFNTFEALISNHIHTYIHNWSLQPLSQDYGPVSHTIFIVWVNFYTWMARSTFWSALWTTEFLEAFHSKFTYSEEICQKFDPEKYFSYFGFMARHGARTMDLRLRSRHTIHWTMATSVLKAPASVLNCAVLFTDFRRSTRQIHASAEHPSVWTAAKLLNCKTLHNVHAVGELIELFLHSEGCCISA